jgi:predicted transcriptional regulator
MTDSLALRSKRIAAAISATMLAATARVNRSRLSHIEHGYIQPTEDEFLRLTNTLEQLISAKSAVQKAAAAVGWPLGEIR